MEEFLNMEGSMPAFVKKRILREEWEVNARLAELQLEKPKLLTVRSTAIGAAADATQFHPANAAGTFSYHHGTFSLRNEHVGKVWSLARRMESRRYKTPPFGSRSFSLTSTSPVMTSMSRDHGPIREPGTSFSVLATISLEAYPALHVSPKFRKQGSPIT
jgi:hypothetical protein